MFIDEPLKYCTCTFDVSYGSTVRAQTVSYVGTVHVQSLIVPLYDKLFTLC